MEAVCVNAFAIHETYVIFVRFLYTRSRDILVVSECIKTIFFNLNHIRLTTLGLMMFFFSSYVIE